MIDRSTIYGPETIHDAATSLNAIIMLCKIGVAAGETVMNVKLSAGSFDVLFEQIAMLAEDAEERIEEAARKAQKSD